MFVKSVFGYLGSNNPTRFLNLLLSTSDIQQRRFVAIKETRASVIFFCLGSEDEYLTLLHKKLLIEPPSEEVAMLGTTDFAGA